MRRYAIPCRWCDGEGNATRDACTCTSGQLTILLAPEDERQLLAELRVNLTPRRRMTMIQAIEDVLRRERVPMTAGEILDVMVEPPTRSRTPVSVVNKWLSTSRRFHRVARGLYTLADLVRDGAVVPVPR